ncbi:TPA: WxL domain-containing protein [Enterococcus faecalis]|nr:WxL domain-containing protein [Enterococcus faecalis]
MQLTVSHKKVTENFKDVNGTAIPAPTGFTQGKKTSITNNNYTFKQSGTLPETYKASNGKNYKFKGWYKGKTKPATLKTTKTPSYAVTYDNNDDLNVVYEVDTTKDYKFPSSTVNFQFVNEAGAILLPTPFTITTDLQQEINSTYTKLGSITGTNSGNTKQVTIPAKTIKADVSLGGVNNYGTTNTRITIPKFYENISLYTGNAYTQATFNQYSTVGNTLIGAPNNNALLYYGLSKVTATQFKMNEFASGANYMYSRLFVATNQYKLESYYTTVGTVYYQLTNRKVTENFVDTNGVKITAPTGFTQGKKTNITNTDYTFTQSGTLPSTYKTSNGKVYKLKGWYKGNTKPATLNTGKPTYKVTYNNNDDLNVVYEETSKDYKFPSRTVNFQFVNEAGAILLPTPFTITTDLQQEINSTYTKLGSITGTNSGNTKQVTIPARTIKADVSLGGVNNYGTTNTRITIPKFYENISLYTGSTYTQATLNEYLTVNNALTGTPASNPPLYYGLNKVTATQFKVNEYDSTTAAMPERSKYVYNRLYTAGAPNNFNSYYTSVGTIYYQLTNRKVTENFVDTNGVKITAPTGFTQGKKTNITNTDYTFTQSGTLPSTYKTSNGKVYKLKGWYKGKTKPATLNTGKPTYKVTYNNNDDLNVVYEETSKDYKFPSSTVNFQFVNEAGTIISPTPFTITTDLQQEINSTYTKLGSITGTNSGNTKQVTIPAKTIRADVSLGGVNNYGTTNTRITIPKFYENISLYTGNAYTQATLNEYLTVNNAPGKPVNNPPLHYGLSKVTATQFKISEVTNGSNYRYSRLFAASNQYNLEKYYTPVGTIYYQLTNRKVTENFVDASGTKITPPTGFTQGNQIPMTSDTFKYTSAKVLPASYSAGGKTYVFQGWYKGKTKPNTLTTSTTPTYNTTFDDNDDMTAVYKEASISANLTMRGAVDVIDNGGTMEYWGVLLKNTGEAPLTSIKIKPTTDWESGISTPTELFILGSGQNTKVRPITKEQWEAGFEIPLDKSLPVGGQLTINLIGTKVTGQPNQVLKAAVEVSGNFNKLTASDTVRIKDLDQETKEPTGEGFISVPTFDFSQVGVASATKQHGLKKAADYYGNGTRNPYVRISKTQPNWSLTAQLSQPKSDTDSLPTATRLILGQVPIYSVGNYNLPTELMTSVGVTRSLGLTADNSSVSIIGNQEFSGADVYQLDFQFDKVKLEVPANQGVKGQQYQAAVTWNLVTGP